MRQIRPNRAKQRLAAGQHVIAIEGLNHPDAIERLAPLQPQAFWLEGEHWIASPTNIGDLTRACDVSGSTSIVRVGRAQKQLIYHALDLGGQGIAVPHVSTAEDAARVVDAAKFAPIGHRGIYISRQGIDVPDYFQRANDETLVVVFIEDAEALDNLDAILEVDHIDVFFVGPGDLSQAVGHVGEFTHPAVSKVVDDTIRHIIDRGRTAGTVGFQDNMAHVAEVGAKFFLCGATSWVLQGFNDLRGTLEGIERQAVGAR
jgi:4-hydroxy-2-oxoheptanedioate aldolase